MTTGYASLKVECGFGLDPLAFGASPTWTDVTAKVHSLTTTRGRSTPLDNFPAGTATIVLKNDDYRFDPDNASSPYAGQLVPLTPVRISANDSTSTQRWIYQGYVAPRDGFAQDYTPGHAETTVSCVDFLAVMAAQNLPSTYTSHTITYRTIRLGQQLEQLKVDLAEELPVPQFAGSKLGALLFVLDAAGILPIPSQGASTGATQTILQGFQQGGVNALQYVQELVATEGSAFYVLADGRIRFDGRYEPLLNARLSTSQVTYADDGTAVPFSVNGFSKSFASQIYNRAVITPEGMDPQEISDTTSITAYTQTDYTANGLYDSSAEAIARAQAIVNSYKDPVSAPAGLTSPDLQRSSTVLDGYLKRELRDRCTVKFKPPGASARVSTDVFVEKIVHNINCRQKTWNVQLEVSAADHYDWFAASDLFILDTSVLDGTELVGY